MRFYFLITSLILFIACSSDNTDKSKQKEDDSDSSITSKDTVFSFSPHLFNLFELRKDDTVLVEIMDHLFTDSILISKKQIPDSLLVYLDISKDCCYDPALALMRVDVNDSISVLIYQEPMECYALQVSGVLINRKTLSLINERNQFACSFGDGGESAFSESYLFLKSGKLLEWYTCSMNSYMEPDSDEAETKSYNFNKGMIKENLFVEESADTNHVLLKNYKTNY